jgi:hypothetical protein
MEGSTELAVESVAGTRQTRRHKPRNTTRPQLLTRDQLDGRTNAAKMFDRLVAEIESDLGGHDQLSTIERTLVEAYVGAAITLHALNCQLALGQKIDLGQQAVAVSAMVRVASRLGLQRRAKDVGMTLSDARRRLLAEERAQAEAQAERNEARHG